jgi:hypothetical protein
VADENIIIIRPARAADYMDIWRLLACEGKHIAMEELVKSAGGYFVLLKDEKLLGTYQSSCSVAVHPLYSQTLVENVMLKAITGLLAGD